MLIYNIKKYILDIFRFVFHPFDLHLASFFNIPSDVTRLLVWRRNKMFLMKINRNSSKKDKRNKVGWKSVFLLIFIPLSWHKPDETALTICLCILLSFLLPQHLFLLPAHTYFKPLSSSLLLTLNFPFPSLPSLLLTIWFSTSACSSYTAKISIFLGHEVYYWVEVLKSACF